MKITCILAVLISMCTAAASLGETRPHLALPRQFAYEEVQKTSDSYPETYAALLRDGLRWRYELYKQSDDSVLVWIGDGTNVLAGSNANDTQKNRIAQSLVFILDNWYGEFNDNQYHPYCGIVRYRDMDCWHFRSTDGVSILVNTNTSVIVQEKSADTTTDYYPIALSPADIEALLSTASTSNALLRHRKRSPNHH